MRRIWLPYLDFAIYAQHTCSCMLPRRLFQFEINIPFFVVRTHDSPCVLFLPQIENGLPAVLVYRGGELVGNLLRVTDHLGKEFTPEDVEGFLQE